jgi:hypothetical protein
VGGLTEGANAFAANDTADAGAAAAPQCIAERPSALSLNRWQEDWSALANPCVPRKSSDALKYIPLGSDPSTYLSLGANLREAFELNNTPLFGLGSARPDSYVIQRTEVHADARIGQHAQALFQLQDARPFGRLQPDPREAVDYVQGVAEGHVNYRASFPVACDRSRCNLQSGHGCGARHGRAANALDRDVWAGSRRLACQFERCARAGSGANAPDLRRTKSLQSTALLSEVSQ